MFTMDWNQCSGWSGIRTFWLSLRIKTVRQPRTYLHSPTAIEAEICKNCPTRPRKTLTQMPTDHFSHELPLTLGVRP